MSNAANVAALTTSIQELVAQLLSGGGDIASATVSIKDSIEASANSNAAAIGNLTASTADVAASTKVTVDAAVARAKPAVKYALHPGKHDANVEIRLITIRLGVRTSKSGWSTGGGDILTIKDDAGIDRQLVTEYGLPCQVV